MNTPDIPKLNPFKIKKSKKVIKRFTPLLFIVSAIVFFAIAHAFFSGPGEVVRVIFPKFSTLKSTDDRVNILLLGMAGGRHDGPYLTDTILVASYNLETKKMYLVSIPRDLWIPSNKSKVNAVYESGLSSNNGLNITKTIVGNIVGLPIHYALRVDFKGFIQAVDLMGGISVDVDNSFDDYKYPIEGKENDLCGFSEKEVDFSGEEAKKLNIEPGKRKVFVAADGKIATDSADPIKGDQYFSCRFEHINFKRGLNEMDGLTALKYVRSRKGTNGEGSDFARSKRQQKVLEAFRNKVLSLDTLSNPSKVSELINTFSKSIDTDISVKEVVEFYKLSKDMDKAISVVIDDSKKVGLPDNKSSLLYSPPAIDYGGAYVLVSQDDDFSTVQNYVDKILSEKDVENEASASARTGNN